MAPPAAFSMLRCKAHFAIIIRTCFAAHLRWLVCRTLRVNGLQTEGGMVTRTLALDTISVCSFPFSILLIPTLGSNVWMLQLVMVIAEDVL